MNTQTNEKPISELADHLGYWLRLVSNNVSAAFSKKLQLHGVSTAEWVVMRLIYAHPETSATEIAEEMGMTRGAISKIVTRLHDRGLLERETLADDRRGQLLQLSREGLRLLPILAGLADLNDNEFFDCLDNDETKQLLATLRKLSYIHRWTEPPFE